MINPQALQTGDLANLFLKDVPVTISRHVTTEKVDGKKGLIREQAVMSGPGGFEMPSDTWYAIDRKSMEAIEAPADFVSYAASNSPLSDPIPNREGLVVGWPIGSEKKSYTGWNGDARVTVEVTYEGTEEKGGLDTYVYKASSAAQEIVDPIMLARFPPALPKDMLVGLAANLDLPEAMKARFGELLPTLPDPVPLKYTYEYQATYWIEPTTGVLIDTEKYELRQVALEIPGLPTPVPVTAVYELRYTASDQAIEDAVKDAEDNMGLLNLAKTFFYILLGVGACFIIIGVVLLVWKR